MKTEDILNEREKTHGDFKTASETHYKAKALFRPIMEKTGVPLYRIEAVEAIIAKINRIAHGNHDYADHWDDIAGYAMLGKGKQVKSRCDCYTVPGTEEFVMCGEHKKALHESDALFKKEWFKPESCSHNNKTRKFYTDAANDGDITLIADICLVCNKIYIADFMHPKFMDDFEDSNHLHFTSVAIALENKSLKQENERLEAENKLLTDECGKLWARLRSRINS